jgi:CheY-like chemotaxis protein
MAMTLRSKLLLPAVLAVSVLLVIVTQVTRSALESAAERSLEAVAEARREDLQSYFERMRGDLVATGSAPAVIDALRQFSAVFAACGANAGSELRQHYELTASNGGQTPPAAGSACRKAYQQAHDARDPFFRQRYAAYGWDDILLVDREANVVYSLRKEPDFASNLRHGPWHTSGLARVATIALDSPVNGVAAFADAERYAPSGNRPAMFLAIPVLEPGSGRLLGTLAAQIAFAPIDRRMHFKAGLGETGEAFVVGSGGWMLTSSFLDPASSILSRQLKTEAVNRVLAGEDGRDQLVDYRGQASFIAYRQLQPFAGALGDQPRWGVIAKISRDEALAGLHALQGVMLGSGLVIALATMIIGWLVGRRLFQPVLAIQGALTRLAGGEQTSIPGIERGDEIGDMARAAESFRKLSATVARERWIHEQVAALTTAVSRESRLTAVPDLILDHLRRELAVPVAALFLRDEKGHYRRAGGQGLARRSQTQDRFAPGEALVGQCARDRQPVIVSPVGSGLALIASGLAELPAEELVLYPISHQEATLAVVELASTRRLSPDEHALLAALIGPLGLHLANLETAERNLALLTESRQQAEMLGRQKVDLQALGDELRGQSEELKVQNTALLASQDELARQNSRLEAQGSALDLGRREAEARTRELSEANRYKSQFLANMSHELRTPLNSILILARHLADNRSGHLDDDEIDSASIIHESGEQLLSLINGILDLSKIEAGKVEVLVEHFAVADLLRYLRRLFEPLAAKKSIDFAIDADAAAGLMIASDRRLLLQILTNLLSNAVKFTEQGTVRLSICADGKGLRFDIVDSGIGIATAEIGRIFKAFEQVDAGTARRYGGTGLGLAISARLVELLGGQIAVDSTLGRGSRFSVHLPEVVCGALPAVTGSLPDVPPSAVAAGERGTLILVVEDDGRLVAIVTRLIEALGYAVLAVNDGERALELIASEAPAGVLLDLGLPGISGFEVLRRIKAQPATAGIPVYIVSGAADSGEATALGAAGYLRKPITRAAVLAAIRDMLGHPSPLAAQTPPLLPAPAAAVPQVLLIEDDEASAQAVRVLFKETAIEFRRVRTGREGLAALAGGAFDALVLDLTLPDMSGFDCLERIAAERPAPPPVVVYSARDLDDGELLRLHAHADAVISKGRLNGETSSRLREEVLLAVARARAGDERSQAPPAGGSPRGTLLIVDDDVRNQSALSKALRGRGFAVSVAANGAQALALLAAGRFAAVLSDIMMPEMDGYELIRRMRRNSDTLPIIAVTARAMPGDIELCLAAGASDYLAKPVAIDRLLEVLEKWL